MTARPAPPIWPYPHRTVAEVWGVAAPKPRAIERPVLVRPTVSEAGRVLIDLNNVPSAMEQRFAGKRA